MSIITFEGQLYREVLAISEGPLPRLRITTVDGTQSQFFNQRELYGSGARELVEGVVNSLVQTGVIAPHRLLVMARTSPAQLLQGYFAVQAVILCPVHENDTSLYQSVLSHCARMLAGLWSPWRSAPDLRAVGFLHEGEERMTATELATLPLGKLLGVTVALTLHAQVPQRGQLEFRDRFRSAPRVEVTETKFDIRRAEITSTKNSGRFRSVALTGWFDESSHQPFKQARVLYDELERDAVAHALREPRRRLRMQVVKTTTPTSKVKPSVTYTLKNLRFEESGA